MKTERSEATVWIARDSDGEIKIALGKQKPTDIAYGIDKNHVWAQRNNAVIGLYPRWLRKRWPILKSMRPGAKPRRLKITMEFVEE